MRHPCRSRIRKCAFWRSANEFPVCLKAQVFKSLTKPKVCYNSFKIFDLSYKIHQKLEINMYSGKYELGKQIDDSNEIRFYFYKLLYLLDIVTQSHD